jgi:CBS domain containing-hemolysin-like protein
LSNLNWLLLVFLVLLDLFFAVIRAALINARLTQLMGVPEHLQLQAQSTLKLVEKPELRAMLRILTGISHILVLTATIWIVLTLWKDQINLAGALGIAILTLVVLFAMEFSLERLPLKNPEMWAISLTPIAAALNFVVKPITLVLTELQGTRGQSERSLGAVTEDELKTWVQVGQPEGGLEKDERRMIYSIFQFGDTLSREIMVPRIDVLALDVNTPFQVAAHEIVESGHSRVPVYEETIDNVIGLLYAKDLLKVGLENGEEMSIRQYLRPAYFVPESKKVDELLSEMQEKGVHLAIVVDEYGGMAGIVTLEDIVEEIVGEIRDEYDQKEELLVEKVSEDEYLFRGRVSLDDFNEALGTHLQDESADTLAGYIYGEFGRVPEEGESLQVEGWILAVEVVRSRRIIRIRAKRGILPPLEEEQNGTVTEEA